MMYDIEDLRKFIEEGFPSEQVINDCPAGITRILSDFVDNELLEDCLEELRETTYNGDHLSASQKFVMFMLKYV